MIKARDVDRLLILSTLFLVVVGIVMVYSTSYIMALTRYGDEYYFIKRHLLYVLIGICGFIVASRTPYAIYRPLAYPILLVALFLLGLLFIVGPHGSGTANRWLDTGIIRFQPSEPAKLSLVVFLSYFLSSRAERIKEFYGTFLPNIVLAGMVVALVMAEPDFGTAVFLSLLVLIMNFIAGVRLRYLLGLVVLSLPFLYLVVRNFSYMMGRILVFLDPWKDPDGAGFQVVQSFLAFGSGGVYGVGLGEGRQKLFYLPEAHTDFIFSVIGEEIGFVGVAGIILCYLLFLLSGTRIAFRAKDLFGTYLSLGLTLMIVLQAGLNMAVTLGMLPPKGLTLPFISYGGTSLVVNMTAVGMILNVCIKSNEA